MNDDFKVCEKKQTVEIPEGGMALIISPGDQNERFTFLDVAMFHNFKHGAKDLTKDEKTLFIVLQGLFDIATYDSETVLLRGSKVMEKFLKGLGATTDETPVDLNTLTPQGRC